MIIIDLEATCWEKKSHTDVNEIIEIGICEIHKSGEITNANSFVVKPRFSKVSPFCTQLTGWTQEDIDSKGRPIEEVLADITKLYRLQRGSFWGSFGNYDANMLSGSSRKGLKQYGITNSVFDGMQHLNIKTLFAIQNHLHKEVGLEKALGISGLNFMGRHHNGRDDAINIGVIAMKCLWGVDFKG